MMRRARLAGLLLLVSAGVLAAGGCLQADPLLSGLAKIAGGKIQSLSVSEIQAIAVWAEGQAGTEQRPLTDQEAQAVRQFLIDNGVNTIADAQNLANHQEQVIISDAVAQVIGEDQARQFLDQLGQAG